ncbi:MAG: protein-disulfide reductase DsbD family protein, partial [Bacteroidia bacterium]|nr:protein-disulfide reductase DsbD family protein [Bacteroidia bacterium]
MRKILFFAAFILFASFVSGQIYDPVTWDFRYEKKGDMQYELIFTAAIDKNSHIYAMDIPEGGPIPTSFSFDTLSGYKLLGKTYEVTKPVEVLDEAFGFKIKTFSTKAEFRQKITAVDPSFTVTGAVNFMACNNATCSPPKDVEFAIKIADNTENKSINRSNNPGVDLTPIKPGRGLLKFFLISLLAGFAGVLTPCVFPMIPMTVAFFSQGSEDRGKAVVKALIFGLSIVLIYSSLGIIVSLTSAGAG